MYMFMNELSVCTVYTIKYKWTVHVDNLRIHVSRDKFQLMNIQDNNQTNVYPLHVCIKTYNRNSYCTFMH